MEQIFEENEDFTTRLLQFVKSQQFITVSLLQRNLKLGYCKAHRLRDWLVENNIIQPPASLIDGKYIVIKTEEERNKKELFWLVESNGDLSVTVRDIAQVKECINADFKNESENEGFNIDDLQYTITPKMMSYSEYMNLPEEDF